MIAARRILDAVPATRSPQKSPAVRAVQPEAAKQPAAARAWGGASTFDALTPPEKVTVQAVQNATAGEEAKVRQAAALLEKVLNSGEFHDEVLKLKGLINTDGLSNEQIYQRILAGSEGATPGADHEADLKVSLYSKWNWWSKEVAWSGASEPAIHLNRKFFSGFEPTDVAGTLAHEWCHQLGFNDSGADSRSVPYQVGEIVSRLAEKQTLAPVQPADPSVPADPIAPAAHAALARGAQGAEVETLQQLLLDAGFAPGPVDGDFGKVTEKALKSFQRARGLPMTGVADGATWAALETSR